MGAHNTDLRIIRTKEAIREALVDLIEEKGFDAITVKDITTRAKINRSTFYAHYQDKFDLITKYEEEIVHEMTSFAKQKLPDIIAELENNTQHAAPFHLAVLLFEFLDEHSAFLKAVLGPKGDLSFLTKLKETIWITMFGNTHTPLVNEDRLLVPSRYLVSYIASAHIGVVQQWLNSGRKESPQEMARILSTITVNGPFYAAGFKK